MIYLFCGNIDNIWTNNYTIKSYKESIERNDRIPNVIKQYLNYCRNVGFEQTPDYEYLIGLLKDTATK